MDKHYAGLKTDQPLHICTIFRILVLDKQPYHSYASFLTLYHHCHRNSQNQSHALLGMHHSEVRMKCLAAKPRCGLELVEGCCVRFGPILPN